MQILAQKQAPRKTPQAQIVNAPPRAYVEPDEDYIGAHHGTAASSTDPLPVAAKRARQKQYKDKGKDAKRKKKGGSVQNTIEYMIESSKLPPAEQALLPPKRLTTKVARPKKGRKTRGGGAHAHQIAYQPKNTIHKYNICQRRRKTR